MNSQTPRSERRQKICILYTGGTMGSKKRPNSALLAPVSLTDFRSHIKSSSEFSERICPECNIEYEFKQPPVGPIDSAAATPDDWLRVRDTLAENWKNFDGFVIIHGTDTLSYLAAFLSFVIEYQDKPLVITGSMRPIFEKDTDATANLLASLRVVASRTSDGLSIDQVLICLGGKILRGNRATKLSLGSSAIETPRVDDLGEYCVEPKFLGQIRWAYGQPRHFRQSDGNPVAFAKIDHNAKVALVRLFPGITAQVLEAIGKDHEALIVESYGSGTGSADVRDALEKLATEKEKFIVICTEVVDGKVDHGHYKTDLVRVKDSPLICGHRLLAEAAFAKMYYLLGKADRNNHTWRKWIRDTMQKPIRSDT